MAATTSRDSAPASLVQRLDAKKIAKQYQALSARIGPPYYWTVDWLADRVGAVRSFDGLNAEWRGNSQAPSAALSPKAGLAAVSDHARSENGRDGLQERIGGLSARRSQGPDLGDGLLHEEGHAGPDDRQARLSRRSSQAAAGLEIPHRDAGQGADPGAQGRLCRHHPGRQGERVPFDRPAAEQLPAAADAVCASAG